ncbi:MAG: family 78 glycoside hydrolase catalytic domain, partial [Eubacteriales bacterium]|nr:family 78 glycoside hydrolase catalytic domain [Eubacteriales bacterium]
MLKISELKCEYANNPIGIDYKNPRFSWILKSDNKDVMQTAYVLTVEGMWDSGKVEDDCSHLIKYNGNKLQPCTRYNYKVTVYDNNGEVAEKDGFFETSLMSHDNWQARWIGSPKGNSGTVSPILRNVFTSDKEVKSARIYATSMGLYEITLNGSKVGDYVLTPGFTSFEKHLQYQTYDVTDMIKNGGNTIGIMLGKGWCIGTLGWEPWRQGGAFNNCTLAALMELHITYADGSTEKVVTDSSWKTYDSPIILSGIYEGETYDARLETNWTDVDFDDSRWDDAVIVDFKKDHIVAQENEPCRVTEEIKPTLFRAPNLDNILDFGQNLVGWIKVTVKGGIRGQRIELRHAEILDKDGNIYFGNLRTAAQKTVYYLKGGDEEIFIPRFTFQGFRYARVVAFPGDFSADNFVAQVIHSDMERTGNFECSNPLINQLFKNVIWGQRGNFVDVPTDCPQRDERLGWTGDAQAFVRTAASNYNSAKFYSKWMRDVCCDQAESGSVPHVIPNVLTDVGGSSGWSDGCIIVPWEIYRAYGDKQILEENFECMVKWNNFVRRQGANEFLWNTGFHFGDWLALDASEGSYTGATPKDLIATAYFAYTTGILMKISKVLGKDKEYAEYTTIYKNICNEFRREFVTPNGRILGDTQTAHVLSLFFGLADHKEKSSLALNEMIKENGNRLKTGFLGTPYLCHALSDNGYSETAYDLLLQTDYPSWLYSVTKGATTIWEHW